MFRLDADLRVSATAQLGIRHTGRLSSRRVLIFTIVFSMNEHDLSQLPPAAQAYIRELEVNAQQIAELNDRNQLLEEQFRLAQSKRFAPSSEKLKDRVFDEAEQMAAAEPADEEDEALAPPDTGLPEPDMPAGRKRGRKPLTAELPIGAFGAGRSSFRRQPLRRS